MAQSHYRANRFGEIHVWLCMRVMLLSVSNVNRRSDRARTWLIR